MKKLIVCLVMLCATMAYATNDDVVNSQMYVDNAVGNLQTNLPAKTSDKVVTYTTTAGTTGERDIKTELGNESTNTSDNGIPTVGTVKTAVDDKQNKLNSLNNVNIVTYTGSQNDSNNHKGRGIVTTTPIYDSTVNTFDNGLVRAKTLNDAVIAGVNAEATKITTDPKGALWVFNRTPPKVLPTTANLPASQETEGNYCYRAIATNVNKKGDCSSALYDNMKRGDFGVTFRYNTGVTYDTTCEGTYCSKEVHGISACSNLTYTNQVNNSIVPSEYWTMLDTAYENSKNGTAPDGSRCYCKIINPTTSGLGWKYHTNMTNVPCSEQCALKCAAMTFIYPSFRGVLFSAAPVPAQ